MRDTYHRTRDCPIFLESKKKMSPKQGPQPNPSIAKDVNHTSHWHQPSQSSSANQPSYHNHNFCPEYQSNYPRYPSQHYQLYNYTPHTSQTHASQPIITYPTTPLQMTYPATSTQTIQLKIEPNNPPPPPSQNQESSQQDTNFPTFGTIHKITRGSNQNFENKMQK
jgi:hypothetical protein